MLEIGIAVNMAVSAFNGIKKAVEAGREIEDVAGYFGKFFDAKEAISEASLDNEHAPIFKQIFAGRSVEAQALEITAAKHKAAKIEKELREFLIYSGQSQFYEDMMIERRHIREARIQQARVRALSRKFWIDAFFISGLIAAVVATLIFGVSLIMSI
jgi:predicted helicase